MHITYLTPLFLVAGSFATPLNKRYDLDGNGVSDLCVVEGDTARCYVSGGGVVEFPATATNQRLSDLITTSTTSTNALPSATTADALVFATSASSSPDPTSTNTTASNGKLPSPQQFAQDKGKKWTVDYVGDLQFTGELQAKKLGGDKCRSSKLGDRVIWNCGDMQCNEDYTICGFSMGPAFYGTSSVMTVNTDNLHTVSDSNFVQPWWGDAKPQAPQGQWGMDTSNVAAINATHGVAYAWEIWRNPNDINSWSDRGNAVASITLGEDRPIATRIGPLLTGPRAMPLGMIAILNAGDGHIYTYSSGGPTNVVIGRVAADDSVFDASAYEFLDHDSATWIPGIPDSTTTTIGASTSNPSGKFGCDHYGSVFFSTYLNQYVIICSIYLDNVNMYVSDTPYGPWSAEYQLLNAAFDQHVHGSYGPMVHREYDTTGDKEVLFSMGPDTVFNMFKVNFGY